MYLLSHSKVQVHASLLFVLNEHGQVLHFSIVPNDTKPLVGQALTAVWNTPGRPASLVTQAVYTDNPRADQHTIQDAFESQWSHHNSVLLVLLDVWHGRNRILRTMNKYHADYKSGTSLMVHFN